MDPWVARGPGRARRLQDGEPDLQLDARQSVVLTLVFTFVVAFVPQFVPQFLRRKLRLIVAFEPERAGKPGGLEPRVAVPGAGAAAERVVGWKQLRYSF